MASLVNEAHLPAILTVGPMTDEAFAQLCAEHPEFEVEVSARGELIVMPQRYTLTGVRNNEISGQLGNWAEHDGRGIAFGSSSGWKLPNSARRSPDAAWILKDRIKTLNTADLAGFWPICPDFVIELRSESDKLRMLREKMADWLANGAKIAWLIGPESRTVEIYRPGYEPETRVNISSLTGEGPVEGFVLDLARVWDPLG
jgi:Uma2 family endonuclease